MAFRAYACISFRPNESQMVTGRNALKGVAENQRRNITRKEVDPMTTETTLARVNAALSALNAADSFSASRELQQLAADLEGQLRIDFAASKGTANATRTLTAILQASKKDRPYNAALHYAWTDAAGRQCVCDGFRAFRLAEALPLEPRPEDAGDPIKLDQIMPANIDGWQSFPLPSIADVKAFIAAERAKFTGKRKGFSPLWDFGRGLPSVNARYLIDLLAVFPDAAEAFVKPGYEAPMSAIYVRTERGDAMLLPVRDNAKAAQYAAARQAAEAEQYEKRQAEKDAIERRKFHDAVLDDMLRDYARKSAEDPEYALTPDQFANMAQYAA